MVANTREKIKPGKDNRKSPGSDLLFEHSGFDALAQRLNETRVLGGPQLSGEEPQRGLSGREERLGLGVEQKRDLIPW